MSTDEVTVNRAEYPYSHCASTGSDSKHLLAAILATNTVDELSTADDLDAVRRYITKEGGADANGKTEYGCMFWLYPTGLYGPFHKTDDGQVERHGVLITVERGVLVEDAVERARRALTHEILHEHIRVNA